MTLAEVSRPSDITKLPTALRFEWDNRKADSNLRARGVSFREATTVPADPLSITISDPDHSMAETRLIDLGLSYRGRVPWYRTWSEATESA
jgi:hypothetical protein